MAARSSKRSRQTLLTNLVGLALCTAVSRGLIGWAASKELGYAAQAACWTLFLVALVSFGGIRKRLGLGQVFWLYVFVVAAVVSSGITDVFEGVSSTWTYSGVMVFLAASMFVCGSIEREMVAHIRIWRWVLLAVGVSFVVALAQQANAMPIPLPGNDTSSMKGTVRPAALTGSYLHYPLVLALAAVIATQYFFARRRRTYLLVAIAFALGVVLTFSRSGGMILVFTAIIYFFIVPETRHRMRLIFGGVALGVVGLLMFGRGPYLARMLSALSSSGSGNTVRIDRWSSGVHTWLDGPVIFGNAAGVFTNITKNLDNVNTSVVESGLIQQLVSFGLIGTVAFYALMFNLGKRIDKRHVVLKAGCYAAMLQTVVYQSIEVFPFMVFLCILPLVSSGLPTRGPDQVRDERVASGTIGMPRWQRAKGRDVGPSGRSRFEHVLTISGVAAAGVREDESRGGR